MKDTELVEFVNGCWGEGDVAREDRAEMNRDNREAYLGLQDYSWKIEGQSTEFLPRVGVAVDQLSASIKRGLIAFGNWFSVEVPGNSFLTGDDVRELLSVYLKKLPDGGKKTVPFEVKLGDGVKQALLESLMVFKVSGERGTSWRMVRDGDGLKRTEVDDWKLRIDLVPSEHYVVDPTGEGRYEIHRIEKDWDQVKALSEGPDAIYDKKAVAELEKTFYQKDGKVRREVERGGNEYRHKRVRRRVEIQEFWGDVLDKEGNVVHRNIVMTVANKTHLLRKPTENPWWHQESPFVVLPLKRVPHSVWHAAMYDDAARLNFALNELFNLMLDGSLGAVWGVRQIREGWMVDPTEAADGIAQGATIRVSDEAPEGAKVVETVATGQLPHDAMNMFGVLDREFDSAARVSDLNKGQLPGRKALATEIIEASQGQGVLVDDIVHDVERTGVTPLLRKSWLVLMQGAEDLGNWNVVEAIGVRKALRLATMPAVARYAMFSNCGFKVFGLSATLAKGRDFQKFMAVMQASAQIPILFQGLLNDLSPKKVAEQVWRMLNLNIGDYKMDEEERNDRSRVVDLMTVTELLGGRGGQNLSSANTNREAAANNQLASPSEV